LQTIMPTSLKALPKAELHIHLEGAMRRDTLCQLCAKHGLNTPTDTRGVKFDNFGGFVDTYMRACECLRDEEDIFRLVREVAEDARDSGAVWIEVALSMLSYHERFGGTKSCLRLILRAAAEAETSTGVGIGIIVAAERMTNFFPMALAEELARAVAELVQSGEAAIHGRPGIVGFGLHGDETGNPPEPFQCVFAAACACCYPGSARNSSAFRPAAIPHAGELRPSPGDAGSGVESVRFCVDQVSARVSACVCVCSTAH
jgi:adenosine deaminase